MPRHVDHVVGAAHDPEVAVLVLEARVGRQVVARDTRSGRPPGIRASLFHSVGAQPGGRGSSNDDVAGVAGRGPPRRRRSSTRTS